MYVVPPQEATYTPEYATCKRTLTMKPGLGVTPGHQNDTCDPPPVTSD